MANLTLSPSVRESGTLASNGSCDCNRGLGRGAFEKLGLDLEALLHVANGEYSDLTIIVEGKHVPVHRCILAMRCPFFRKVFSTMGKNGSSKHELELDNLIKVGRVGYEAFMTVMEYVYGGKWRPLTSIVECLDSSCAHVTCRPAIDYVLELLCSSLVFDIWELKGLAQQYLRDNVDKFQVDDVVHVLNSACIGEDSQLKSSCINAIASSNLDILTIEKEIFGASLEQVRALRIELGRGRSHLEPTQESQCKRIHRALDLDDIELVQLLLDEQKLDLDGAHALHYAAAYCNPKTLAELLDLRLADPNLRNERGMTVLHVASWRGEPEAVANLLANGARVKDSTLDDQTALDICKRLVKKIEVKLEEYRRDRLCVEILEQAENNNTAAIPKSAAAMLTVPSTEKELMSTLLYLENRASLARLLFPQVFKIVKDMSHLEILPDATTYRNGSPMVGISSKRRRAPVDLNEMPTKTIDDLVGVALSDEPKENQLDFLRKRCKELQKKAEMARRFFPCYSAVIDKYVLDDDWIDLSQKASEEQLLKKRRYVELKSILQDAFQKDRADLDKKTVNETDKQKKIRKTDVPLSSSSSITSRGTSGSPGSRNCVDQRRVINGLEFLFFMLTHS